MQIIDRLRTMRLRFTLGNIGFGSIIKGGFSYNYPKTIYLHNFVTINDNVTIYGKGGVEIGDNCMLAPGCRLISGGHMIDGFRKEDILQSQPSTSGQIILDGNNFIGANVVILEDCTIGYGAVIGAGSVVTKGTHIPSGAVAAGIPAKVIRMRKFTTTEVQ